MISYYQMFMDLYRSNPKWSYLDTYGIEIIPLLNNEFDINTPVVNNDIQHYPFLKLGIYLMEKKKDSREVYIYIYPDNKCRLYFLIPGPEYGNHKEKSIVYLHVKFLQLEDVFDSKVLQIFKESKDPDSLDWWHTSLPEQSDADPIAKLKVEDVDLIRDHYIDSGTRFASTFEKFINEFQVELEENELDLDKKIKL